MSFPQKASLLPTSVGLSPYPLTTYHLLGAALYLSFLSKKPLGVFPVLPGVLSLRIPVQAGEGLKVRGRCWIIFLDKDKSLASRPEPECCSS